MGTDMTQGKILPVIIRFTIPLLLGNLFQQFYNIADTMIVGRFVGSGALAAVGATGTITFLIIGFSSGMSSGFAVVTSQRYGARDEEGMKRSVTNGIILMVLITVIMTVGSLLCMRPLLKIMNTPEDIFEQSWLYIIIICGGLAANVFYNLLAAFLRAVGNSKAPLFFLIFSTITNIALDLLLIAVFRLGVAGAALATVGSQLLSAVLCWIYILKKVPAVRPRRKHWKMDRDIMEKQLVIGIPMALQFAITASGTMIMQAATNLFGSVAVAAHTAAAKCQSMFQQGMVAMGQTMAAYCGQNYGSGRMDRVKKGVRTAVIIMTIYSCASSVLVCVLLPWVLRLFFTGSGDVEALFPWARTYIYMCAFFYVPLSYIYIFRNAMQGCSHGFLPMAAGVVEMVLRLVVAMIAMKTMSYPMSCFCDPAAWLGAGIFTGVSYLYVLRQIERNREAERILEEKQLT